MTSTFKISNDGLALDPIQALDELFRADRAPGKMNLVLGVLQNDDGLTPVLPSIKLAEAELNRDEQSKAYLPIVGDPAFLREAARLVFGREHPSLEARRLQSMQTPGGTGALRMAADFVRDHAPGSTVWLSAPAYSNHRPIMESAGLPTAHYRYYDHERGRVTFDEMIADLQRARSGDVVLLHARCHNPSGADPSLEQWQELARFFTERRLVPLIDAAYLGFAEGLEEDAEGLRLLAAECEECLIATSFSKIFALYGERVGMLTIRSATEASARTCIDRAKVYARRMYISPPSHGARLVAGVLGNPSLTAQWRNELDAMRQQLLDRRMALAAALDKYQMGTRLFPALRDNRGMFVLSRLDSDQVRRLREEHHVYMLESGRISLAGLRSADMDRLRASIASVI